MEIWDLIYAIEKDDLRKAKELLLAGLCPNESTVTGHTALCVAADSGKAAFVKLLLESGANPDKADEKVTMDGGATPLALAASKGHEEAVRLLLEAGAKPSLPSKYKETPLEVAVFGGFPSIVEGLLAAGAGIDEPTGFDRKTALMVACEHREKAIFDLLLSHGASLTSQCRKGKTALHYGAGFPNGPAGKSHITKVLLAKGASVQAKDKSGETPIFGAARWEDSAIMSLLLEAGADPNITNKSGDTALLAACRYNTHPGVVRLLVKSGANAEVCGKGKATALHLLCKKDALPADGVAALIEAQVNVGAKDEQGNTPLHDLFVGLGEGESKEEKALLLIFANSPTASLLHGAARSCTVKVCLALIENGALIDEEDDWKRTALHWVAHDGKLPTVDFLLARGANVNAVDDKGNTPLHLACRQRHLDVCKLLLRAGAKLNEKNFRGRPPLFYCDFDFIRELSLNHPEVLKSFEALDEERRENLRCYFKRESLEKAKHCPHCGWSSNLDGDERVIHCPWCLMFALVISDYKVLHGNPEIPTADTEVEFTYSCDHCGLTFVNGWNAMNTDRPHVLEIETKTSWLSEDGGQTWQRHWGFDE